MATHSIGKVFIELDLDPSRYTRAQQTLLKEAQHGATILEKNFKNLQIKSSATFDLMRAQAVKSFEAIKKSGKATTDDLVRAEKAKAEKLRRINEQQYGHTTSMFDKIKQHWMGMTATIVAAWYSMGRAIRVASDVVMAAARYETLGVSMRVVGNNAGYTYEQLTKLQGELEETGISMRGSRQAIIKMAQAQIDLSKATELARGAQHAAVIGNIDSTEAFNQMVYGIQSANVRVLRTIGINVSFEDSYKKLETQLGRTKETFTQSEKAGARLGATLEALTRLSGTYEAAMETAGKQVLSLNRHFDNLKTLAGAAFTPALLEGVQAVTGEVKNLNKELRDSEEIAHEWGVNFRITLIDIEMDFMRLALLLDKIGGTMTTVMVGLFSFGNVIGNENSQRQYTKWMKKNLEYEKRYWQAAIDIVKLEEKQLALAHSLTDEGRAQAKAKLDALEKVRLAIIAEEKARRAANKAVEDANEDLDKYWKTLQKHKSAMAPISLAAFPKFERGIESIIRKYAEWNKAIKKNAEAAGYTTDEIALLYANLGLRMDEEIKDYVKSHEKGNDKIYDLWQHTYEKMTDILADFYETGKFNLKDFVDFFKRQLAQMAAAWTMGSQTSGGFSFANMFGGMFGGGLLGVPQPGSANFIGPVQAGVQGASAAYSLSGAYGAYTSAGGGWAGLQAGTSSFFSGGSSIMPYVAAAVVAYNTISSGLSSAEEARKSPFASSWERGDISQIANEGMARLAYPVMGEAANRIALMFGTTLLSSLGLLGGIAGILGFDPFGIGDFLNSIFGNKKRSYLGREYEYGEYSPETGWGAPGMTEYKERRKGEKFRDSADAMAQTGLNLMNSLDSMFKDLLGVFGEDWTSKFSTGMIGLAAGKPSFDFYISAEDKGEFEDDWRKSWQDLTKNLIDPMVDIGADLLEQALDGAVTDATAWNYFTDEMREYLETSLEDSLADLKVDWSTVTDQESFEAAIEQMGLAAEQIANVMTYFDKVGTILEHITTIIDMHDYSESIKGAVSELKNIESEFLSLRSTLEAAGVDLERYIDLQIAYNMAIEDWINKAFVGAISYASTSQGWQAMAPQSASSTDVWIGQYQHIQDLYNAYDGTTASAIELSDALGILSGLSYDLAAEIQGAINSIHQSYASALESMYLETLSGQGKYDYYRTRIEELYAELPSLTSVAAIQQYMDDILQYSTTAYGMMDEAQKQQYYAQYEAFLRSVETEGTARLEEIGNAMDDTNDNLIERITPLIENMVTDIHDAAQLQMGAADTQVIAAGLQLDAAGTPMSIDVNIASNEVG